MSKFCSLGLLKFASVLLAMSKFCSLGLLIFGSVLLAMSNFSSSSVLLIFSSVLLVGSVFSELISFSSDSLDCKEFSVESVGLSEVSVVDLFSELFESLSSFLVDSSSLVAISVSVEVNSTVSTYFPVASNSTIPLVSVIKATSPCVAVIDPSLTIIPPIKEIFFPTSKSP